MYEQTLKHTVGVQQAPVFATHVSPTGSQSCVCLASFSLSLRHTLAFPTRSQINRIIDGWLVVAYVFLRFLGEKYSEIEFQNVLIRLERIVHCSEEGFLFQTF